MAVTEQQHEPVQKAGPPELSSQAFANRLVSVVWSHGAPVSEIMGGAGAELFANTSPGRFTHDEKKEFPASLRAIIHQETDQQAFAAIFLQLLSFWEREKENPPFTVFADQPFDSLEFIGERTITAIGSHMGGADRPRALRMTIHQDGVTPPRASAMEIIPYYYTLD
ncbi:MAG TPA: hypothetical protein VFQ63_01750 [Patescibacteria group bacterium]|nr:hypothetical protein [Patescibacteria group bacterium]